MLSTSVRTKTVTTSKAHLAWKGLNGIFAVFKPAGVTVNTMKKSIISNLYHDLNKLNVRKPMNHVKIIGETNKELEVVVQPSFADHINLVGPRYQFEDIKLMSANKLPRDASGVVLLGTKDGTVQIENIRQSTPTKFYRVTAKLGVATVSGFESGRLAEQTSYDHVYRNHIESVCASFQSSHQKAMFNASGLDIQSQEAYELAKDGLIRPADKRVPMLYSIKCTYFCRPYFNLEIVCINEQMDYIQELVDEIGVKVKSSTTCSKIQCFQYGMFDSNIALLSKHWTLEHILNNMRTCRNILDKNGFLLKQRSPHLVEGVK